MEDFNNNLEDESQSLVNRKTDSNQKYARLAVIFIIFGAFFFAILLIFGIIGYLFLGLPNWAMATMIVVGFSVLLFTRIFAIKTKQNPVYYECKECHYTYVPKYKQQMLAPHVNTSKLMKCPKCGKISLQKKVMIKKD